jgi:DNA-binding GntR family transcriptional regulator
MTISETVLKGEFLTKKEYVARWLREMVISGAMRPGTRIRQQEIAEALGVSATPIREAIRQLETEGYLDSIPHVGASVRDVNREGLDEIYHVRALLESWLARQAAVRITDADVKEFTVLAKEFERASARDDVVEARRSNYRLHQLVWEKAGQPVTVEIVRSLWAKFPWDTLGYVKGRGDRSVREHDQLIYALEARDADAAEVAIRAHIASGKRDFVVAQLQNEKSSGGLLAATE